MSHEQQPNMISPRMLTMALPSPSVARPTNAIEIVRAESELQAIDELMADLTAEFVPDANR